MTRFEKNAKLCLVNNNALVVERNVLSLVCEWCWVRLPPLQLWWQTTLRQWLCVILSMGPVSSEISDFPPCAHAPSDLLQIKFSQKNDD